MIDLRRLGTVARFELRDALRSKLVVIIVGLFAAGAGMGAIGFIKASQLAEERARQILAEQNAIPADAVPIAQVKEQALKALISSVEHEGLREALLAMQPLAIFYGFLALYSVPLLVLLLSGGTHAADIQSGAARFALFRCSRPTWALGKLAGHACLLALGLLVGAIVAGAAGAYLQPEFEARTWAALLMASLRAWVYGVSYLGIFSGISLIAGAPLRARALSLLVLIALAIGHGVVTSAWLAAKLPPLVHLRWLFPAQYGTGLWVRDVAPYVGSVVALFTLGGVGFSLGTWSFMRRDA